MKTNDFINNIHDQVNEYMTALLAHNGGTIAIGKTVTLPKGNGTASLSLTKVTDAPGGVSVLVFDDAEDRPFHMLGLSQKEDILRLVEQSGAKEPKKTFFPITSVSREDLEARGFNTKNVGDDTMERLASKMGDAYVENGFWEDMYIIAEYLDIPRRAKRPAKKEK